MKGKNKDSSLSVLGEGLALEITWPCAE